MYAHIVLGDIGRNAVSLTGTADVIPCRIYSTHRMHIINYGGCLLMHGCTPGMCICNTATLLPGSTVAIGAGIANNADDLCVSLES